MLPRFFAPTASASDRDHVIELPDEEAQHLTRVLRLTVGDSLRVFDGKGLEWRAEIAERGKRRVTVRLMETVTPAQESRVPVTLMLAVLKGEKMDAVLRDTVALGVAAIHPLVTERTEIGLAALRRSARTDRWQRVVIAAVKQCGRAIVPVVHDAQPFDAVLETGRVVRWMLTEPGSHVAARAANSLTAPAALQLLVGPEGGWTQNEIERASLSSVQFVTLGSRTLRADLAPVVALSAFRALWNDL